MYDSSRGMLIGFIVSILIVASLGFSVNEYHPEIIKRTKYKLIKMKILPKKKPPEKKEVKKEIKPDIKPEKVEKKEKKIIKKKKKKKKPKKKKVVAKKPINQKKEEPKKEKPKEKSPPVFGVTMSSVSKTGNSNFKVQVGNTLMTDDKTGWENGKPKKIGKFVGEAEEASDGSNIKEETIGPPPKIVSKPIPKKVFRPKYTKLAEEEEIEGKIILSLTIDKKGNVVHAKIIKGLGYGLDKNALDAVKKFKFSPAVLSNGKTKKTKITYTINFILEE